MKIFMIALAMILTIQIPAHAYDYSDTVRNGIKSASHQGFMNTNPSNREIENYETQEKLDDIQYKLDRLEQNQ